jgi:hypothetical protein
LSASLPAERVPSWERRDTPPLALFWERFRSPRDIGLTDPPRIESGGHAQARPWTLAVCAGASHVRQLALHPDDPKSTSAVGGGCASGWHFVTSLTASQRYASPEWLTIAMAFERARNVGSLSSVCLRFLPDGSSNFTPPSGAPFPDESLIRIVSKSGQPMIRLAVGLSQSRSWHPAVESVCRSPVPEVGCPAQQLVLSPPLGRAGSASQSPGTGAPLIRLPLARGLAFPDSGRRLPPNGPESHQAPIPDRP